MGNLLWEVCLPMVKRVLMITLIIIVVFCCFSSCNMLPKGELIKSVESPSKVYTINAYLCDGGATVDFAVRCEVVNNDSKDCRDIYWDYHISDAEIIWINDEEAEINGHVLKVWSDYYDYRN